MYHLADNCNTSCNKYKEMPEYVDNCEIAYHCRHACQYPCNRPIVVIWYDAVVMPDNMYPQNWSVSY